LRIYGDGVLVDIGVEREYVLLDVAEWQIDRKKIKEAGLTDAGLRVDCRGDQDRVVTLWLVLPTEQERHKWKVYLLAGLHPTSKEGQHVRQMVAQVGFLSFKKHLRHTLKDFSLATSTGQGKSALVTEREKLELVLNHSLISFELLSSIMTIISNYDNHF
jgi:hypothetical protein